MRILIVNTVNTRRNGITNVIFNLLKGMEQGQIVFDLFAINTPSKSYIQRIESMGGTVYVAPRDSRHILQYFFILKKRIKENRYDAIHIHGNSHTVVLELLAAKLSGCKVRIVHAHSTKCSSLFIHTMLSPMFHRLCTHRLACGIDAGEFMYEKRSFKVVNNGVDTEQFAFCLKDRENIREKYNLKNKIVIGHVGVFSKVKNQTFLLDILQVLRRVDDRYCLLLIGEGDLIDFVKAKALQLGVDMAVIFIGGTDEVSQYLSAMDIIMMPSLFEGLPLTLIEEQANGLTCLVSETITKEVDKTGNVVFLPLEKGADVWGHAALRVDTKEKRVVKSQKAVEEIKKSGYDIRRNVEDLQQYYDESIRGGSR